MFILELGLKPQYIVEEAICVLKCLHGFSYRLVQDELLHWIGGGENTLPTRETFSNAVLDGVFHRLETYVRCQIAFFASHMVE